MPKVPGTHWLRENHQERSPHRLLVFDTETSPIDADHADHHALRLWCARLVRRHDIDPKLPRREDFDGRTAAQLVDLIESTSRADRSLWVMSHNLNFDLAVTELPVLLTQRGWRLTEGALTTNDPWCRFAKGRKRLTIADTWSFLPTSVEELGEKLGIAKVPLPDFTDADDAWHHRCAIDVDITETAISQLMDWWDRGRYGNWSLTGPATGWSSYRHRKPAPRVLVEPDPDARALEMRAVTGGRRGVSRVGLLPLGLYADVDVTTAHLTVMGNYFLPARRLRSFAQLEPDDVALRSQVLDCLAECVVNTESPRYPWDSGRGLFYPTGKFTSVLAGPEIRAAHDRGELVSIGRGYVYTLGTHMQPWAHWLAGLLDERATDVPPTAALAAKHWSRCVPGKWAGHTSEVVSKVPDPRPGWALERGWLPREQQPADFLRIGGELWTIRRDDWAEDAFPAILAWIQSYTRLALNRMVDLSGGAVRVCNTDGALLDVHALAESYDGLQPPHGRSDAALLRWLDQWCATVSAITAPFVVRPKGAAKSVTVLSPQHLILDDKRRLAGVPSSAVALGGHEYKFTAWPKLRMQLVRNTRPGYVTEQRKADLSSIAPAGWLTEGGSVIPPTVVEAFPDNPVRPPLWDQSVDGMALAPLARQHPVLRRALTGLGLTELAGVTR